MWNQGYRLMAVFLMAVSVSGCMHTIRSSYRGVLRVIIDPHTLVKSENTALLHSEVVQYFSKHGFIQSSLPAARPDYILKGIVTDHDICNTAFGLTRISHAVQITTTVDWKLFMGDGTLVWQGPVTASQTVMKPSMQSVHWYHVRNGLQVVYRRLAKILYVTICQRL